MGSAHGTGRLVQIAQFGIEPVESIQERREYAIGSPAFAAGMGALLSHEEVLAGARAAVPKLKRLLQEFVKAA